jgi:hypothetical protein
MCVWVPRSSPTLKVGSYPAKVYGRGLSVLKPTVAIWPALELEDGVAATHGGIFWVGVPVFVSALAAVTAAVFFVPIRIAIVARIRRIEVLIVRFQVIVCWLLVVVVNLVPVLKVRRVELGAGGRVIDVDPVIEVRRVEVVIVQVRQCSQMAQRLFDAGHGVRFRGGAFLGG